MHQQSVARSSGAESAPGAQVGQVMSEGRHVPPQLAGYYAWQSRDRREVRAYLDRCRKEAKRAVG